MKDRCLVETSAHREGKAIRLRSSRSEYEKRKKEGQKSSDATPSHLYIPKTLFLENSDKLGLHIEAVINEDEMRPKLSLYEPSAYRYTVYATKSKIVHV